MATLTVDDLRSRAASIAPDLVVDTMAVPGGGTLPGVEIPSVGLRLDGDRTADLRASTPPVIARVADQATLLDLRTVHPDDDAVLGSALDRLGAR